MVNDNDISEGGQDYGMRIYNRRLGKFLSVDPLTKEYSWNSPYSFAENDVLRCIDMDGLERYVVTNYLDRNNRIRSTTVTTLTNNDNQQLVNMQLLCANSLVTRRDVLVRNVRFNGTVANSGKASLNAWERRVLRTGNLTMPTSENPTAPVTFDGGGSSENLDCGSLTSQKKDFLTSQFILRDRALQVGPPPPVNTQINLSGGFFIGTSNSLIHNGVNIGNGSFDPNSIGGIAVINTLNQLSNQIVNNPNVTRVTINVSGIVGLNSTADPSYTAYQNGLNNVAINIRNMLSARGVNPNLIQLNVPPASLSMNSNQSVSTSSSITTTTRP